MGGDGVCTGDLPKLGAQAVGKNVICGDGGEALMDMKEALVLLNAIRPPTTPTSWFMRLMPTTTS